MEQTTPSPAAGRRRFPIGGIDEAARTVGVLASSPDAVEAEDGVPEVLEGPWDLERFRQHPTFLWNHDPDVPLGTAKEIAEDYEGLKMRLGFMTAAAGPEIEQHWQKVLQGGTRGVSVRWEGGDIRYEDRGGVRTRVVKSPSLVEVSLTPLPLDPKGAVQAQSRAPIEAQPAPGPRKAKPRFPLFNEYDDDEDEERSARACRSCEQRTHLRADYPWEDCMSEQLAKHGDEATAAKICGSIKAESGRAHAERGMIVAAARLLAHARQRARGREGVRTDAAETATEQRFDAGGKLERLERTAAGGFRVRANVSRIGVVAYRLPDGSVRRELRHPDEVFRADSMASLRGAPVVAGHPYEIGGLLDPGTWRRYTRGHATDDVRQDGEHVAGTLVVNDAETADKIDRGELGDISPGYRMRFDATPGEWRGQRYDGIQRDITYNHVSLEPPGRGRQGSSVGLRLDAQHVDYGVEETTMKTIRLDGKDFEIGSEQHLAKVDELHAADVTRLDAEHKTALDKAHGERDGLKDKLDTVTKERDDLKTRIDSATDPKAVQARVDQRVELEGKAKAILGEVKLDGKTDREVMVEAIKSQKADFDDKDRGDEYIRARFDALSESVPRLDSVHNVVLTNEVAKMRLDAGNPVVKAQIDAHERDEKASRAPLTAS